LRINWGMLWGAIIQLVSGIALAAPLRGGGDREPDPAKLGVKLVVAIAIFAMTFFSRKRDAVNRGHFLAIVGLTLVNAAVAVFWRCPRPRHLDPRCRRDRFGAARTAEADHRGIGRRRLNPSGRQLRAMVTGNS